MSTDRIICTKCGGYMIYNDIRSLICTKCERFIPWDEVRRFGVECEECGDYRVVNLAENISYCRQCGHFRKPLSDDEHRDYMRRWKICLH